MKDISHDFPYDGLVIAAAVFSVLGLGTMVAYMLHASPQTMFLCMAVGPGLIVLSICAYGYAVIQDYRAKLATRIQRTFKPGELIYQQGDEGDRMYIITKGTVEVLWADSGEEETVVDELGEGDHFGEEAVRSESGERRQASMRAATYVETGTIDRTEFANLCEHIPTVLMEAVVKLRLGESDGLEG